MVVVGDLHNNGKAVRRAEAPDGHIWFDKPRSVFWEWLFFGLDSPLKEHIPWCSDLFRLEVQSDNLSGTGRIKNIEQQRLVDTSHSILNFGSLLGYAYCFGIQDLFVDNLIERSDSVQPIDSEIVLSQMILPSETSLLPFRNLDLKSSGIGMLSHFTSVNKNELGIEVIKSFLRTLCEIGSNRQKIVSCFRSIEEIKSAPIRVLVRGTSEYRDWMNKTYSRPLIEEEVLQLERGDIPYFFKYLGSEDLYFQQSENTVTKVRSMPQFLHDGLKTSGVQYEELLSEHRIESHLKPVGTFYLLKTLLSPDFTGSFNTQDIAVSITLDTFNFTSNYSSFKSSRTR